MNSLTSRTSLLLGENIKKLQSAHVLIVGIGGVGGYVFELLLRAGVENFTIVDGDCVEESNLNRQILASINNIGMPKVEAACLRALSINSEVKINALNMRYNNDTSEQILNKKYDYCIDCFDSVKDKIHFIVTAKNKSLPILSAMGAGNRLTGKALITDIFSTSYDGLAKAVRKGLRESEVQSLKVALCEAAPLKTDAGVVGSISYVPASMACVISEEVIKDLICR